jgi:AraC family transcriptional regulator
MPTAGARAFWTRSWSGTANAEVTRNLQKNAGAALQIAGITYTRDAPILVSDIESSTDEALEMHSSSSSGVVFEAVGIVQGQGGPGKSLGMSTVMHTPFNLIAEQLLSAARCAMEADGLNLRSHVERIAGLLRSSSSGKGTSNGTNHLATWRTNRLFRHIESNLSQRIETAQLAGLVGLSQGHLMRVFKRHFGVSIRIYISCRRIAMAQRLMVSTSHPLVEISLRCGMCDQAHFTRTFGKLVGETPSSWRARQLAVESARGRPPDTTAELLQRYDSLQGSLCWRALQGALGRAEVACEKLNTAPQL